MVQTNQDHRVSSWAELQEMLYHESWDEDLGRFRSSFVYRGLSDVQYDLKTSLCRLGGEYDGLEGHLLRNFRKYSLRKEVPGESIWNWLAVAQHHGLPTRLLDWTYSPLVALHFATSNFLKFDVDAAIWCVNYVKANEYLPHRLGLEIKEEGSNVFTPEMLDLICKNLKELDQLQEQDFLLFLEPPALDDRIVNQHALFSMMSNPRTLLNEFMGRHPELYYRIIIPKELKWEIRDKLDQSNITERVLFPGLDGLSTWLKRHYSPKGAGPDQA